MNLALTKIFFMTNLLILQYMSLVQNPKKTSKAKYNKDIMIALFIWYYLLFTNQQMSI